MFAGCDLYDLALTHTFAEVGSARSRSWTYVCLGEICMI